MKIQLISDVHVEFWRVMHQGAKDQQLLSLIEHAVDVLVIAGDLNTGRSNTMHDLRLLSKHVPNIVYVPGNHEYYDGLRINDFNDSSFKDRLPENVHFMNPGCHYIDGVKFFGGTLWTDFHKDRVAELDAQKYINDFRRTEITTQEMALANSIQKEFVKERYNASPITTKKVIVTHFLPAMECVAPQYRDGDLVTRSLNKYFANSMGDWIATLENATWLFGHTHDHVDIVLGQTRCLAHPVGYPGEHKHAYEPLIITV